MQDHWESIYQTKSPEETSWFQPHLQTSLDWIVDAAPYISASIVDVGGGESTLVHDLLARHYRTVTVLDIAEAAIGNPGIASVRQRREFIGSQGM
jgi:2-polyprenyl-3-methyl-5-hydroxy-6-metoxy-1,4-benzoquinol methylase